MSLQSRIQVVARGESCQNELLREPLPRRISVNNKLPPIGGNETAKTSNRKSSHLKSKKRYENTMKSSVFRHSQSTQLQFKLQIQMQVMADGRGKRPPLPEHEELLRAAGQEPGDNLRGVFSPFNI